MLGLSITIFIRFCFFWTDHEQINVRTFLKSSFIATMFDSRPLVSSRLIDRLVQKYHRSVWLITTIFLELFQAYIYGTEGRLPQKCHQTFEFSLNVFTEFSDKKYYILKRLFEPETSWFSDQDATTVPARHR